MLPAEYRAVFELLDPDAEARIGKAFLDNRRAANWEEAEDLSWKDAGLLFYVGCDDIGMVCYAAAKIAATKTICEGELEQIRKQERQQQASLLREIFGNPFRPSQFRSIWRSPRVMEIAVQIYESDAFDGLPGLAQALVDAGCENEDMLAHYHQPSGHVRGCWALDQILNRH